MIVNSKIYKIIKKNFKFIMVFFVSGIFFTSVSVYAALTYLAKDITYVPKNKDFKATNVEEALNILYDKSSDFDPDTIEKLWAPVGSQQNSFSGTYQFKEKYKWVIVIFYTDSYVNTVYKENNMVLYKDMLLEERYNEGAKFLMYKDVDENSSIFFSINNCYRSSITVYGIK